MKYDLRDFSSEEKLNMLTGYAHGMQTYGIEGRLPFLWMSDGPHGLRYLDTSSGTMVTRKAIAYPSAQVMASTWNPELVREAGAAIGDECAENGVAVLLAPGVNIKRVPNCGRNFEYFSEDPLLSGTMGRAFIEGVQSKGVGASLKHFAANNREYDRMSCNSEIDERTLREIYLRPFEIALKAKPWTVMNGYNALNGVFMSEHERMLKGWLRGELGFDGLIVSDWGSVKDRVKSLRATVDLEMPHRADRPAELREALAEGRITQAEIDAAAGRLLELAERFDDASSLRRVTLDDAARRGVAERCAREGIVLLKNEGELLPLTGGRIAVLGDLALSPCIGGGGSSRVECKEAPAGLPDELRKVLPEADIRHESVHYFTEGVPFLHKMKQALQCAAWADAVVIVVGDTVLQECEAFDRPTLKLYPLYEEMIRKAAAYSDRIVVVLEAGGAVDCSAWIDRVGAVVYAGFGGERINAALASVLAGQVNPSGKLTETFPAGGVCGYAPVYPRSPLSERYTEGVFVGYRYYDSFDVPVDFPFGFGLSYSRFAYSELEIVKRGRCAFEVSFRIDNLSQRDGKEAAQVYVRDPFSMVERPAKELAGFVKAEVPAGGWVRCTVTLDETAFRYYSVGRGRWLVEGGDFEILIGASCRDIRLRGRVEIAADREDPTFV